MAHRVSGIPHHRERSSLQSIKDRNWVIQTDLYPAGKGTIASMLKRAGSKGERILPDRYNFALPKPAKRRWLLKFRSVVEANCQALTGGFSHQFFRSATVAGRSRARS